ncbi:hypothetical protein GCK72_013758 [Caenorhabditis remanei]|uniref:Uncharacterized protein n=1 Tax=Caenorhabditis remanei TaxID=31234 RepID=A0A6A5GRV3_CAERE|nr:hypothetical protein GCK72_013758 [Caenorhabditis remanei]KAF1757303.1 hypothetical protein GCK72_013758 [Caenorhabditis remanei]
MANSFFITEEVYSEEKKKELKRKRLNGDFSQCNISLILENGEVEKVDAFLINEHSEKYKTTGYIFSKRIDVSMLETGSVKDFVHWMYTKDIVVMESNVCNILKTNIELIDIIVSRMKKNIDLLITALNGITEAVITETPQTHFRPYSSLYHHSNQFISKRLIPLFCELEPRISMTEISKLNVTSVYVLMNSLVGIPTKVRLIFLAMDWIVMKNPSNQTMNGIIQSVIIEVGQNCFSHDIRYNMHEYLTNVLPISKLCVYMDGSSEIIPVFEKEQSVIPPNCVTHSIEVIPRVVRENTLNRKPTDLTRLRRKARIDNPSGREPICGFYQRIIIGENSNTKLSAIKSFSTADQVSNDVTNIRWMRGKWHCDGYVTLSSSTSSESRGSVNLNESHRNPGNNRSQYLMDRGNTSIDGHKSYCFYDMMAVSKSNESFTGYSNNKKTKEEQITEPSRELYSIYRNYKRPTEPTEGTSSNTNNTNQRSHQSTSSESNYSFANLANNGSTFVSQFGTTNQRKPPSNRQRGGNDYYPGHAGCLYVPGVVEDLYQQFYSPPYF